MFRVIFVLSAVFAPSIYRALDIEAFVSHLTGVSNEAFIETMRSDYLILAPVLMLLLAAVVARKKAVALSCFAAATILQALVVIDVLIYDQFGQRLSVMDVKKYGGYTLEYLLDFNLKILVLIILAILLSGALTFAFWQFLHNAQIGTRVAAILALAISASGAFAWQSRDAGYVHYRFFQNFVSYNRTGLTELRQYSKTFASDLSDPFRETCHPAPKLSGDLIIYMVESLSSYHSGFFGGLNDWTPRLDRLASNNLALRNFYANGFTTEDGELSLITAEFPIYPPNTMSPGGSTHFTGYWNPSSSIVSAFETEGYRSYFLTTSDLAFSSTGDWMASVGFDSVEGSEAAFFNNWPRFHFNAAPDAALLDRILAIIHGTDEPELVFVKTASSHHPFIEPETGVQSEEQVIRYVDRQIDNLHRRLSEVGFFEHGHLIIVGDHRAMRPIASEEVRKYGLAKAYTQVPAVVVGPTLASEPRSIHVPYSQADIANSLIGMAKEMVCTSQIRGAIWGQNAISPDFIIHRRGDLRNQFSVFAGDRLGVVTLNGDKTYFSGDGFNSAEKDSIVEFINFKRVKAGIADAGGKMGSN